LLNSLVVETCALPVIMFAAKAKDIIFQGHLYNL